MPIKEVCIQGVKIVYREEGKGTPLFLLHGLGAAHQIWNKNIEQLAKQFRVIAPDLPGCGLSDKPILFDYSLLHLTQFIQKFILSFNEKNIFVAGNSLGGGLALLSATPLASILRGLILISPISYPQVIPDGFKIARFPVVGELSLLTLGKWTVRFVLKESVYDPSQVTQDWVDSLSKPVASFKWRLAQMKTVRGILPKDIEAVVASYKKVLVPTQIIWGEKDFITPTRMGPRLQQDIAQSQLTIIPKTAHIPHWEKPQEVNALICDFLGQQL